MYKWPPLDKLDELLQLARNDSHHPTLLNIQGYQLNMAVFSGTLEKVTFSVYTCTVAYKGHVTLYKEPQKYGHV